MIRLLFFELPLVVLIVIVVVAVLLVSLCVSCVVYLSCLHRRRGVLSSARPPLLPAKAGYIRQASSSTGASTPVMSPRVHCLGGSPYVGANSPYTPRDPKSPHVNSAHPSPRLQQLALPPSTPPQQYPPDYRRKHLGAVSPAAPGSPAMEARAVSPLSPFNAPVACAAGHAPPDPRRQPVKSPSWEDQLKAGMFRKITLDEVRTATCMFSRRNFIGEGGFAVVYRGRGPGEVGWAVKRSKRPLTEGSPGARDFEKEVMMISQLSHKNLVRLLGYCIEAGEYILVYELAANGSLGSTLSKPRPHLSFIQRLDIAIGVAEALHYLHTAVSPPIVHRDIKPDNILLDRNLRAKVGDFGLLKSMLEAGDAGGVATSAFTRVAGTPGYLDPDYHRTSKVTTKGDVYSFGVVLLELLTGQKAIIKSSTGGGGVGGGGGGGFGGAEGGAENNSKPEAGKKPPKGTAATTARENPAPVHISHWVGPYVQARDVAAVADPRLGRDYDAHALLRVLQVALQCVRSTRSRPDMAAVLRVLVDARERAVQAKGEAGLMTVGEEGEGEEDAGEGGKGESKRSGEGGVKGTPGVALPGVAVAAVAAVATSSKPPGAAISARPAAEPAAAVAPAVAANAANVPTLALEPSPRFGAVTGCGESVAAAAHVVETTSLDAKRGEQDRQHIILEVAPVQ